MRSLFVAALCAGTVGLAPQPAGAQRHAALLAGIGYGKLLEDGAPGGSVGFTLGVTQRLLRSRLAVGLEGTYQLLGSNSVFVSDGTSTVAVDASVAMIPVTVQLYAPLAPSRASVIYLGTGAGLYTVRTSVDVVVSDGQSAGGGSASENVSDFGFNVGLGTRTRHHGSIKAWGVDARYHGIAADAYIGMLTIGLRAYF